MAGLLKGGAACAQTLLSKGDLLFTSFDALPGSGMDSFSFILLAPIDNGTVIRFTDRSYNGTSFAAVGGTEGTVDWKSNAAMVIGTEIKIVGLASSLVATGAGAGTVTRTEGTGTSGINLSTGGDQLFAFQGASLTTGSLLCGLHFGNCTASGSLTTDAGWDGTGCSGQANSVKPSTLTAGTDAMWTGTTLNDFNQQSVCVAGRFNCSGMPASAVANIRTAVLNKANWTFSASSSIPAAPACNYYGTAAPVFTTNPAAAAICAGGSTAFSAVATGAASYQWQVSTNGVGGTYVNVSNGVNYSNATTATLNIGNVPAGFDGYAYRCNATNSGGTSSSGGAVLTVVQAVPTITAHPSDAAICAGSNVILSGGAANGAISYKWQVNTGSGFADIADGGVYAGTATAALSVTGAPTSMYGYVYRLKATNTCGTSFTNGAVLTFRASWTGSTNVNWSLPGNWACNIVPDSRTDVFISSSAVNQPLVNAAAQARSVNIAGGASLTVGTGQTLSVYGDIFNLGTFTASSAGSTVHFAGASSQTIPDLTYQNLTVSAGSSKVLSGNTRIDGTLAFSGSKIILGANTLTLGTAATVTGAGSTSYIVTNGTGSLKKMGVGSPAFIWPVGSAADYSPVTLSNTGVPDHFSVRVIDGVYGTYSSGVPQGTPIGNGVVGKTWYVEEDAPGGSAATMTVQWNSADEQPGFSRASCFLSHYTGTAWNGSTPVAAGVVAGGYTVSRSGITGFSPFGVGNAGTPLPVDLISFGGIRAPQAVRLTWLMPPGHQPCHFTVERGRDARHFQAAGAVVGNEADQYGFQDTEAPDTRLYYRLKITESNGSISFSKTIVVAPSGKAGVGNMLSPNPSKDNKVSLQVPDNQEPGMPCTITVLDFSGRQCVCLNYRAVTARQMLLLDLSLLAPGSYVVQVAGAGYKRSEILLKH